MSEEIKIYNDSSLLITEDAILSIKLFNENTTSFERGIAYLHDDFYLLYRGEYTEKEYNLLYNIEPGIYRISDTNKNIVILPESDEDMEKYTYEDKISSIETEDIIHAINTKEKILINVPESSKLFIPVLSNEDDILKRLIKKALIEKGIDIDQYRHRFENKNELFNFKQVVRNKNKLSILLFDRGCEALNLKYTVIIEEADPNDAIGNRLETPIVATSDEEYDL